MKPDFGPRPELSWLRIDSLYVDTRYQRTMESRRSQVLVDKIAAEFRWSKFGAVLVTKTDPKRFAILDGQHRTAGAGKCGIESVPCLIIECRDEAEQALAFVGANRDRVAVNSFALHFAMVAARDEKAMAIKAACDAAGVEIPRYPIPANKMKPGQTMAIGAISTMVRLYGPDRAGSTLRVLMKAWGASPGVLRAPIVAAIARLLNDKNPPLQAELVSVMKRDDYRAMFGRAQHIVASEGGSQAGAWYRTFVEALARPGPLPKVDLLPEPAPAKQAATNAAVSRVAQELAEMEAA